jgi:hypothetical protein
MFLITPNTRKEQPEQVEYPHFEFYAASEYVNDKDGLSGTAPHFELTPLPKTAGTQ